jgi:hypothetical protein
LGFRTPSHNSKILRPVSVSFKSGDSVFSLFFGKFACIICPPLQFSVGQKTIRFGDTKPNGDSGFFRNALVRQIRNQLSELLYKFQYQSWGNARQQEQVFVSAEEISMAVTEDVRFHGPHEKRQQKFVHHCYGVFGVERLKIIDVQKCHGQRGSPQFTFFPVKLEVLQK